MSRSVRKTIAYGKSTSSRSGRGRYGYMEDDIKKAQREGRPVPRCHERDRMQSLNDYRKYIHYLENESFDNLSSRERRLRKDFYNFIENEIGPEKTVKYIVYSYDDDDTLDCIVEELMDRFALKLYKRALSR